MENVIGCLCNIYSYYSFMLFFESKGLYCIFLHNVDKLREKLYKRNHCKIGISNGNCGMDQFIHSVFR